MTKLTVYLKGYHLEYKTSAFQTVFFLNFVNKLTLSSSAECFNLEFVKWREQVNAFLR